MVEQGPPPGVEAKLCLDFVNTLGTRPRPDGEELHGYADLLSFAERSGVLRRSEAEAARHRAQRERRAARIAFARAIALREALYRIFIAQADGRTPRRQDLAVLNEAVRRARQHQTLSAQGGRLRWQWEPDERAFDRVLWPIATAAADLLVSPQAATIRECASETCSWLFLDRSRGTRRRWCDMRVCGNRNKVRRFYLRQKKAGGMPMRG